MGNIKHWRHPGRSVVFIAFLIFLSVSILPGCSPKIIEKITVQHDTTQVVKLDSVWVFEKDSVFVKERGDTVFTYVEKIRYRDRFKVDTLLTIREFHDTTTVEKKVEKELTVGQKMKIKSFWFPLIGLIAALVWIFRKPIINLIKTF